MSEHDKHEHCDCGCSEESVTVTLTLDNDEEIECAMLVILQSEETGNEYIALLPLDENGEQAGEDVYIYRYIEHKDAEPELENIDSDDEYEIAADLFDEWLDTMEFEELDAK